MTRPAAIVRRIGAEFPIGGPAASGWTAAQAVPVGTYWSGEPAPEGRHFSARLLWSDDALFVRFDAARSEDLVVSAAPVLDRKTVGLWDRDVCEIFLAPNPSDPQHYYEFEVAPTGEWIDLELRQADGGRETVWDYSSGMLAWAEIGGAAIAMALRIPWTAFPSRPSAGDVWAGNLFRCVGSGPSRGYLAWSPTFTEVPQFHIPERFGLFRFE